MHALKIKSMVYFTPLQTMAIYTEDHEVRLMLTAGQFYTVQELIEDERFKYKGLNFVNHRLNYFNTLKSYFENENAKNSKVS